MVLGIADLLKKALFMALLARDSGVLVFNIKMTALFLTKISNMNLKVKLELWTKKLQQNFLGI